jgi:hypothetical protein
VRDDHEHPDLPTQFTQFARSVGRDGGDLYRTVCERAAEEPEVYGLLERAESAQQRPHLLLAAVHYLLLGGADDPLAERYATVAHVRGLAPPPPAEEADGDRFVAFCARYKGELEVLIATRATQTNEIGRCTGLLPALATVSDTTGAPLSVVDLGTSAGLNLLFDRYAYTYARDAGETAGAPTLGAGDPSAAVQIACALRGDAVPPLGLPAVASRAGVDLRPADPADPDQARWLLACLWPHDLRRFTRLEAALALAAALEPAARPTLYAGDLVDAVGAMAADAPPDSELCLFHSWVVAYLTPGEQRALCDAVADASRRRRVWWLFAESPFEAPELPFAPAPGEHDDRSATALMLVRAEDGAFHPHRLADMHYHGTWLHWWGAP